MLKKQFKSSTSRSSLWRGIFDIAKKQERIKEIELSLENPAFWNDSEKAISQTKELARLQELVEMFEGLKKELADIGTTSIAAERLTELEARISKEESKTFFSGTYDGGDAILTITAGAGGQDAEDWATMLFRMYQKFCEKKGWDMEIIHESFGDMGPEGRIGIQQVSMEVKGTNAYGFLKKENGVHRLVRISPFSAKALRHTSFAAVEVLPEVQVHDEHIEIRPEDLQVEATRSSGPGGQNVNKRETAIRIVHVPTGIAVESQTQRSQQKNKERALEILGSKLYQLQETAKKEEMAKLKGKTSPIEWGSQIRSYVLHPYRMVKDHRTNKETSDTASVLNGALDEFIEAEISLP